ncbi:MAG: DUF4844 domain-containing protein [Crocinitomicaceae bacterium]
MTNKEKILLQLNNFKKREKFSRDGWEARGLNPSAQEMSDQLEKLFNNCTEELIQEVENDASSRKLKGVLKSWLGSLNSFNYDTEEREFIAETFYELANIVSVNISSNLNNWMYGKGIMSLLKIASFLKGKNKEEEEVILETLSQDCPKCGVKLETFVLEKEEGVQDDTFKIIQCNRCAEYSLLSLEPNIKQIRFGDYKLVEQLKKDEFSEEEAQERLEQIRYYRK